MDIYLLALQFRQAAIDREEQVNGELLAAYVSIYRSIEGDVEALAAEFARLRSLGYEPTVSDVLRHQRLTDIMQQVAEEVGNVAQRLGPDIERAQRDLIGMGRNHAEQMMLAELSPIPAGITLSFNRFNVRAVDQMVGFLADGTPVREILDELGPEASAAVRDKLIQGIGRGRNPRRVAADVLDAFGGNYARAERIVRTESHRAYREASRQTYTDNRDIIEGWVWTSARDDRVCMSCLMMDGTLHQVDEIFGSHANCRCAMRPRTKSWSELGIEGVEDTRTPLNAGEDWFLEQPAEKQLAMLGPSKYAAWQDGAISLRDLVHESNSPVWGLERKEASLSGLLGIGRAREYYGGKTPAREVLLAAD